MPTTAQAITNGYISSYLARLYNDKSAIFNGGALAAPTSPVTIKMVSDSLEWGSSNPDSTAASLLLVKNYLIWLCGKFGLQSQFITNTGGVVNPIIPVPVTSPSRIDFTVSGSSYIITGATTFTISTFVGFQLNFVRNGITLTTLNTEPSYFSWNSTTGDGTITPALQADEVISLIPS